MSPPELRLVQTAGAASRQPPVDGGGSGPHDPTMDQVLRRLDRLEDDMRDVKGALGQLVPKINEIHGFLTATLPTLATKAELAEKPSKAYLWTIIAVLTAIIFSAVALGASLT